MRSKLSIAGKPGTEIYIVGRPGRARDPILCRLAEAQNWRCAYCGVEMLMEAPPLVVGQSRAISRRKKAAIGRTATVEHVVARSAGGRDDWSNLVAACHCCNTMRGAVDADHAFAMIEQKIRRGRHPHQLFLERGTWEPTRIPPT